MIDEGLREEPSAQPGGPACCLEPSGCPGSSAGLGRGCGELALQLGAIGSTGEVPRVFVRAAALALGCS